MDRSEKLLAGLDLARVKRLDPRNRLLNSEAEVRLLRDSLAPLQASTSWRITAPMRALATLLRRR